MVEIKGKDGWDLKGRYGREQIAQKDQMILSKNLSICEKARTVSSK